MQTFKLIRAFRDWAIDTIFTRSEDGLWSSDGEFESVSSHVCDTLLDVGGYFEDITPVVFTPTLGSMFYYITGAGEIKSKEWTNSTFCNDCKNFMGVFSTTEEAETRLSEVRDLLEDND